MSHIEGWARGGAVGGGFGCRIILLSSVPAQATPPFLRGRRWISTGLVSKGWLPLVALQAEYAFSFLHVL